MPRGVLQAMSERSLVIGQACCRSARYISSWVSFVRAASTYVLMSENLTCSASNRSRAAARGHKARMMRQAMTILVVFLLLDMAVRRR